MSCKFNGKTYKDAAAFISGIPMDTPEELKVRKGKQGMKLEKELENMCENWLRLHGIFFIHLSCRARETAGIVDLNFAINGQACGVELKAKDGVLSDEQVDTMARMKSNGWRVQVVKTFEEFLRFIEMVTELSRMDEIC
jgi:hypothetical protein